MVYIGVVIPAPCETPEYTWIMATRWLELNQQRGGNADNLGDHGHGIVTRDIQFSWTVRGPRIVFSYIG